MTAPMVAELLEAARVRLGGAQEPPPDLVDPEELAAMGYTCVLQDSPRAALKTCGVPEKILRAMFAVGQQGPFRPKTPAEVIAVANEVAGGAGLYVWGDVGAGKSHVAACGLWKWRWRTKASYRDTTWLEWTVGLDGLREDASGDDRNVLMDGLCRVPLLVLDDLGPTARATPFAVDSMRTLVTRRTNECLQTVVTSNHSPETLGQGLLAACKDAELVKSFVSRLRAVGPVRQLRGTDKRTADAKARAAGEQ